MKKKDLVYVCSPLSDSTREGMEKNMKKASYYAALVKEQSGDRAIAPHSFLPEYLDDHNPKEREAALAFGLSIIKISKAVIVCGDRISKGMKAEIGKAREWGIPVYRLWENETGVMVTEYQEEKTQ